jgi:hypothetical protein
MSGNRARKRKWPYIVVIIEELANAMLSKKRIKLEGQPSQSVGSATENILADLAARGRATGIHLVVTTQSPRSDVISGLIKANFPCRVAFGTASDMDSRVIIDDSRAQGLRPGRMVYLDCADYHELQAPFVTEEDRATILKYVYRGDVIWLKPRTPEQRLLEDINLILTVAARDLRGQFDLPHLLRAPDIQEVRLTPDRINHCVAILVADKMIEKRFLSQEYKIAVPREVWAAKYKIVEGDLPDWYGQNDDVIDVEVVEHGPTSGLPRNTLGLPEAKKPKALCEPKNVDSVEDKIRLWDSLGYSRTQMVQRLGIGRPDAYELIISVLGPAKKQGNAACSKQS